MANSVFHQTKGYGTVSRSITLNIAQGVVLRQRLTILEDMREFFEHYGSFSVDDEEGNNKSIYSDVATQTLTDVINLLSHLTGDDKTDEMDMFQTVVHDSNEHQ